MDIFTLLEQLPIYQHFLKVANTDQKGMINANIKKCIPLLDRINKTFSTYTLHNIQHQVNIIRIMGEILGDCIEKLSSLETALLVLAAIYHDIGMVYHEQDLKTIKEEDSFKEFIEINYGAKLDFEKNNQELTVDLTEWYCRWMHARRVWNFLRDDELQWGKVSLKKAVGDICESHNEPATNLGDDDRFETDFLKQADTRFCAILLRLADILDFDSSRSPQSVYEFLELDKPKNQLEEVSRGEWEKHLASDGFTVSHNHGTVELSFSAGPKHPEVERTIHKFLDIIEQEIDACNRMLSKCDAKWRELKITPFIDRKDIRSQNYKKGSYRLSLDEKQIITLLTGENLYSSSFDFLRELLQNAIDASRMREFHEHYLGNSQFKSNAIHVTSWVDTEGFRWIRVDDQGMGLNEYIIENHLLKKGNSFYKSKYFQLLQYHYQQKTGRTFTPISRFGIGLLSCFILGDKIEITSKAVALDVVNQPQQLIRLSITGLDGDYILQTASEKHQPAPFPSQSGQQIGFRSDYGTGVAVRIKGSRDYLGFDDEIKNSLTRYITCSPVSIYYNGDKLGVDFTKTLTTPFCSYKQIFFSQEEKVRIASELNITVNGKLGIEIIPVDITSCSSDRNLMGQLCIIKLVYDDKIFNSSELEWQFEIILSERKSIKFIRRTKNTLTQKDEIKHSQIKMDEIFDGEFYEEDLKKLFHPAWAKEETSELFHYIKLVHNGIDVPNGPNRTTGNNRGGIHIRDVFSKDMLYYPHQNFHMVLGIVYLQDNLIPDLSVSRDTIKRIGFNIYSSLYFATQKLNAYIIQHHHWFNYLNHDERFFTCHEIMNDYNVVNGHWDDIALIYTQDALVSVSDIKKKVKDLPLVIDYDMHKPFISSLVSALLNIHFHLQYTCNDTRKQYFLSIIGIRKDPTYTCNYTNSRPLLFVDFDNDDIASHGGFLNKKHWLVKWLLANEQVLVTHFENYLHQLLNSALGQNIELANNILEHLRKSALLNAPVENLSEEDFVSVTKNRHR